MKKFIITAAIVSIFTIPFATLHAQEKDTYNESVVVKGSYRPVIDDHQKINFPTEITDTISRIEHSFNYSIAPSRLKALYEPSRIKAARIIGEPATKLYNNYLRIGMGDYWSPLADLYWSSTRDKLKTYGIRVNHRSSWGTITNYGKNHFGLTDATAFGKYIVKEKVQLSADLSYEHDHNLYYGFHDSTLANRGLSRDNLSLSDYRASYNLALAHFGVSNMQLDANKLGYAADVRLSDLWGLWGQNELNLNLSGDVHYGFNIKDQYKGVAYLHAEWDAYSNRVAHDGTMPLGYIPAPVADTVRSTTNIVKVNPYAVFLFRGLNIHAGFTLGWDGGADADQGTLFMFFPDVVISKHLMKDNLVLSLAATGGLDAISLNAIRQINPYVSPDIAPMTTTHYDFIGHARWSISRKLEANAEVCYSLRDNDPVFLLNPLYNLNNVFDVRGVPVNRLIVGGDISFVNDEIITLRAGGHYYHYSYEGIGSITPDWYRNYRPGWDALVAADVNYHDIWLFHLEGSLLGGIQGDNAEDLPLRYGIGTEVEYRHNRALSFFLRADNLAFQRYYFWSNYPSQRCQFLLGLTYTIPHK